MERRVVVAALGFLLVVSLVALAGVVVAYSRLRVLCSTLTTALHQYQEAVDIARGHLFNMSSSDLPGVTTGAIRTLDAMDRTIPNKELA